MDCENSEDCENCEYQNYRDNCSLVVHTDTGRKRKLTETKETSEIAGVKKDSRQ